MSDYQDQNQQPIVIGANLPQKKQYIMTLLLDMDILLEQRNDASEKIRILQSQVDGLTVAVQEDQEKIDRLESNLKKEAYQVSTLSEEVLELTRVNKKLQNRLSSYDNSNNIVTSSHKIEPEIYDHHNPAEGRIFKDEDDPEHD